MPPSLQGDIVPADIKILGEEGSSGKPEDETPLQVAARALPALPRLPRCGGEAYWRGMGGSGNARRRKAGAAAAAEGPDTRACLPACLPDCLIPPTPAMPHAAHLTSLAF